jgi:hypothetical protein
MIRNVALVDWRSGTCGTSLRCWNPAATRNDGDVTAALQASIGRNCRRLRGLTCIACVARAIHVPGLDRGTFSNFLQTWYNCYILLQLVSSKRWQDERFNRSHCLQRGKIIDQFQLWLWESRFDFRFICFSLRCRSWASQLQVDHDPP